MTSSPTDLLLVSFRALIGAHRAERMPRLWTLLPLLKRWSAIALVDSTPSPFWMTWLMIVREAWILGCAAPLESPFDDATGIGFSCPVEDAEEACAACVRFRT